MTDVTRLPKALMRWFSEQTHQGLIATDRELRVIVWNQWMETHTKRPASDALGRPLLELFPDLVERGVDHYYREALAGRIALISHGLHRFIVRVSPTSPDQGFDEMPQSGRIVPLSDDEEVIGTVTTIDDISDRLASEAELRKQIEVQKSARDIAEQAVRAKDEFLATVSHEIRNPLNAVLGWTRILIDRDGVDAEMLARALRIIDRNATAQVRMIDDLLDVARIASGKLRLEVQPVDLLAVALGAVDVIGPSAKAKQIEIRTRFDPNTPRVLGDQQRLQQIIWNLLSNAVKFTEPGGTIDIGLVAAGNKTRMSVRDSGQGIHADFLPFVFERFRQSDGSSTRRHGGLGLGLALARELVELHGGSIRAESAGERQGATFTIEFPTAMSPDIREHRVNAATSKRSMKPPLAGLRVLVLEDEVDSRELIAKALSVRGAKVVTAASCDEGLEIITRQGASDRPQLIVSDIAMPKADGFEFLRKLRLLQPKQGGRIPVIAVTGYANPEDKKRALTAGFRSHVSKPIQPEAFAEEIARVAREDGVWRASSRATASARRGGIDS